MLSQGRKGELWKGSEQNHDSRRTIPYEVVFVMKTRGVRETIAGVQVRKEEASEHKLVRECREKGCFERH